MPDARVQAAIDHWGSRLIANGIAYDDFKRVTGALERWDDWLQAWVAVADDHLADARRARDDGHLVSAGEAFLRAAVSYHFAKFVWVLDAERNRETTARAIAAMAAAHELLDPSAVRIEVPFGGASLAANLRRPPGAERPPLVLLIPGLDSTKEEFFWLEEVFLRRGMATLSMDGPGQGESGFALSITPRYEEPVGAVLDALAPYADVVDLDRIGAVGVSMGGYYAPRAAAFEPRLRAVVGISGPYDMSANWDGLPSLTRETLRHHTGASSDAEARERAAELCLAGVAERIAVPALILTGKLDRLIPWEDTKRIADEIPGAEWVLYEHGTHVCNNVPFKSRPLVGDWIAERLGATAPAPASEVAAA